MLLAIDTATRWTGLALTDGNAILAEHGWRSTNTHTQEVTPAIEQILARAEITPADLIGIGVAIGPGSYTGLRIGLAIAKGFALANGTPLVGVPTMDILAAAMPPMPGYRIMAIAEAGRKRVLAADYRHNSQSGCWKAIGRPDIATWADLLASITSTSADDLKTLFVGEISADGRALIESTDRCTAASIDQCVRRAGILAALSWERVQQGDIDSAQTLQPNYMRNPDGSRE